MSPRPVPCVALRLAVTSRPPSTRGSCPACGGVYRGNTLGVDSAREHLAGAELRPRVVPRLAPIPLVEALECFSQLIDSRCSAERFCKSGPSEQTPRVEARPPWEPAVGRPATVALLGLFEDRRHPLNAFIHRNLLLTMLVRRLAGRSPRFDRLANGLQTLRSPARPSSPSAGQVSGTTTTSWGREPAYSSRLAPDGSRFRCTALGTREPDRTQYGRDCP
jgi:hypothetical protein